MKKIVNIFCVLLTMLHILTASANARALTMEKEKIPYNFSIYSNAFGEERLEYWQFHNNVYVEAKVNNLPVIYDVNLHKIIADSSHYFQPVNGTDVNSELIEMNHKIYILFTQDDKTILLDSSGTPIKEFSGYVTQLNDDALLRYTHTQNGINIGIYIYNIKTNTVKENTVYDIMYPAAFTEQGGFARLKSDQNWYWVDGNGEKTSKTISVGNKRIYANIGNDLFAVADADPWTSEAINSYLTLPYDGVITMTNAGLTDKNGNIVLPMEYSGISALKEGFAILKKDKLYGFINTEGSVVINPVYHRASNFSEELACVKKGDDFNGFYGYINKSGTEVIPFEYKNANSFSNGVAEVQKDWESDSYYINNKNEPVSQPNRKSNHMYECDIPDTEEYTGIITDTASGDTFDFTGTGLTPFLAGNNNQLVFAVDSDGIWYQLLFHGSSAEPAPLTATTCEKTASAYQFTVSSEQPLENSIITIALYSVSGKFLGLKTINCNGGSSYNASIPVPQKTSYAKVFTWETLSSLIPLGTAETVSVPVQ